MGNQIPLELPNEVSFDAADFIITGANEHAAHALLAWPDGGHHAAILTGPEGSGKSHLSHMWARRNKAYLLTPESRLEDVGEGGCYLFENIDRKSLSARRLFHIYNWVKEQEGIILFTSRLLPGDMPFDLPDLVSRLKSCPVFDIHAPDDQLLALLLAKQFADRQLQIDPAVINFILARVERRFDSVQDLVRKIDETALAEGRSITLPFVRRIMLGLKEL